MPNATWHGNVAAIAAHVDKHELRAQAHKRSDILWLSFKQLHPIIIICQQGYLNKGEYKIDREGIPSNARNARKNIPIEYNI
jgi:hypothetical protein